VVCSTLPTSLDLLCTASTLQRSHQISPAIELWAAANPVTETSAELLEAKVDAGATTFLTQPPLAWDNFERWMEDAHVRQVTQRCQICVGVPMLTSPANLRFWISLCGASVQGGAWCQSLLICFGAAL
jgi:5,10-methylenetetrahydrofolate reductase